MHETQRTLLVTEVLPPPDAGPQEAQRLRLRHQERVTAQVTHEGGEVLVRVGQGCVAALPDPERGLRAAEALLVPRSSDAEAPARLRAALHLGTLSADRPAIAQPGVAAARKLLEGAGPNEILLSAAAREALSHRRLSLVPLGATEDDSAAGFRLLVDPLTAPAAGRSTLSGWMVAAGVVLASAAAIGALAATLLL